jgi:hypothetical protein
MLNKEHDVKIKNIDINDEVCVEILKEDEGFRPLEEKMINMVDEVKLFQCNHIYILYFIFYFWNDTFKMFILLFC